MWSPLQPFAAAGLLLPAPHRVNHWLSGNEEPTPLLHPYPHLRGSTGQRTARHVLCPAVLLNRVIKHRKLQDVPIQSGGQPPDLSDIFQGLPLIHLIEIKLAGPSMAGATSSPLTTMMPLPLRFQVVMTSEPTLCQSTPSGSPPLLVSSAHRPRWQFVSDHRRRCSRIILLRCDWVGQDRSAPPTADDLTGAPPLLEGNDHWHHLHLRQFVLS